MVFYTCLKSREQLTQQPPLGNCLFKMCPERFSTWFDMVDHLKDCAYFEPDAIITCDCPQHQHRLSDLERATTGRRSPMRKACQFFAEPRARRKERKRNEAQQCVYQKQSTFSASSRPPTCHDPSSAPPYDNSSSACLLSSEKDGAGSPWPELEGTQAAELQSSGPTPFPELHGDHMAHRQMPLDAEWSVQGEASVDTRVHSVGDSNSKLPSHDELASMHRRQLPPACNTAKKTFSSFAENLQDGIQAAGNHSNELVSPVSSAGSDDMEIDTQFSPHDYSSSRDTCVSSGNTRQSTEAFGLASFTGPDPHRDIAKDTVAPSKIQYFDQLNTLKFPIEEFVTEGSLSTVAIHSPPSSPYSFGAARAGRIPEKTGRLLHTLGAKKSDGFARIVQTGLLSPPQQQNPSFASSSNDGGMGHFDADSIWDLNPAGASQMVPTGGGHRQYPEPHAVYEPQSGDIVEPDDAVVTIQSRSPTSTSSEVRCPVPGCPFIASGKKTGNHRKYLQRHYRYAHSGDKFPCGDCGQKLSRKDNLKSHQTTSKCKQNRKGRLFSRGI